MKRLQNKYFLISLYATITVSVSALIIYFIFNFQLISSFFGKLFSILSPIFTGFIITYLISPVVNIFETKVFLFKKSKKDRTRTRRVLSMICAYVLVLALLSAILSVILPQLYSSFETFANNIGSYQQALEKWISSLLDESSSYYPMVQRALALLDDTVDKLVAYVTELIPKAFLLIKDISVVFVNILISIFVSIYMISKKEYLAAQFKKLVCSLFSKKWVDRLFCFVDMVDDSVGGFIRGKIIDSAIIGVLCYIVMSIFRLDYAMLISVIVGITNVIPFFGPFIGAIPSALILLMVNPREVIPFVIIILLIQQLDGNFIGPKILGSSMGLSAFWILVAIIIMSGLFGFAGMIIGVPLFSVAYVLVERLIDSKLKNKNLPVDVEAYYGRPKSEEMDEDVEESSIGDSDENE